MKLYGELSKKKVEPYYDKSGTLAFSGDILPEFRDFHGTCKFPLSPLGRGGKIKFP